ncbi:MAG: methylmalonyl Co-A mutase-associated GTPase MeaB [Bacteroidia bacterium]|nr:methylmalonyl Co-A mutase-associated GTPase MeaB [Bacteroidia bacterium]
MTGRRRNRLRLDEYFQGIIRGDRVILGRAITLIESELKTDRQMARALLDKCMPYTGNAYRIGITGVPGVGKSTFIDAFGEYLIEKGNKVAVLAVDPSSAQSGGSILGDKTRMQFLSQNPKAFVRPSPNSGTLGGVTRKSRESLLLCEASGYEMILVETVGVGQSELAVKEMTDFFLLLMLPNAGDELQGIKRGIMEMADAIFVNKADGDFQEAAQRAKTRYSQAMRLMHSNRSTLVPVMTGSGLHKTGLDICLNHLQQFREQELKSGGWSNRRKGQAKKWLKDRIENYILDSFWEDPQMRNALTEAEKSLDNFDRSPDSLAEEIISRWREK